MKRSLEQVLLSDFLKDCTDTHSDCDIIVNDCVDRGAVTKRRRKLKQDKQTKVNVNVNVTLSACATASLGAHVDSKLKCDLYCVKTGPFPANTSILSIRCALASIGLVHEPVVLSTLCVTLTCLL